MITLYYWGTPNGHKISICLEELGVAYKIVPINISKNEQFAPGFLKISPNNKIPAIVDDEPRDGGEPISIFESGAILSYLAQKYGKLVPTDLRARIVVDEWLYWQVGGLGPMFGQKSHFLNYAPEKIPYAVERYSKESERLLGVLEKQLADKNFIAGEYSIADIAVYPWLRAHERLQLDLSSHPNIRSWLERVSARPAVTKAYEIKV